MMKLALILMFFVLVSPAEADWSYGPDEDGDAALLTDGPCTLEHPDAELLKHATLKNKRGTFTGCWILGPQGVGILWEPAANDKGWRINPSLFRKVTSL